MEVFTKNKSLYIILLFLFSIVKVGFFQPGMNLYAIVIDGQEVDTKRIILTK